MQGINRHLKDVMMQRVCVRELWRSVVKWTKTQKTRNPVERKSWDEWKLSNGNHSMSTADSGVQMTRSLRRKVHNSSAFRIWKREARPPRLTISCRNSLVVHWTLLRNRFFQLIYRYFQNFSLNRLNHKNPGPMYTIDNWVISEVVSVEHDDISLDT